MKQSDPEKLKKIPRYLVPGCGKNGVPGMIKRHVAMLCASIDDEWRLFSEGCLRNRYFRDHVIKRGPKCMACDRKRDDRSKIEQHHGCYLRNCIGALLPEGSEDLHRAPRPDEFPGVPDCRQCHIDNPDYFQGCIDKIYPVHAACHGRIHEKERSLRGQAADDLKTQFYTAARSWVPVEFYDDKTTEPLPTASTYDWSRPDV